MIEFQSSIDLLSIGKYYEDWPFGKVIESHASVKDIGQTLQDHLIRTNAEYILLWDPSQGYPDPKVILEIASQRGDVWHAGLKLGQNGMPRMFNFVNPTWMLQVDPPRNQESSCWRLSLNACLIKTEVIKQLGGPDQDYETLAGAGLELGYRYFHSGVFIRYAPDLLSSEMNPLEAQEPTTYDELRFIRQFFGDKWVKWTLLRSVLTKYPIITIFAAYKKLLRTSNKPFANVFEHKPPEKLFNLSEWHNKVSILIPTLERYSYLRVELEQLRHQTVRPAEILIMDQTPEAERDESIAVEFSDLPLKVFYQNTMGQCTGWNQGLLASTGEYFLFLGDDADLISPDFIERFLRAFQTWQADMVACIVNEVGANPVPERLKIMRIADSFPIAMIHRNLLMKSGLMDYAFDRGARADQDLGIRCFLSGGFMIVDPSIEVLHHHAPRGGLRAHKARAITYAQSRNKLFVRSIASTTEIYLVKRYFNHQQQIEHKWLNILGTFSIRGNKIRKMLKIIVSGLLLPNSLWQYKQREIQAQQMLMAFPQIPTLNALEINIANDEMKTCM